MYLLLNLICYVDCLTTRLFPKGAIQVVWRGRFLIIWSQETKKTAIPPFLQTSAARRRVLRLCRSGGGTAGRKGVAECRS